MQESRLQIDVSTNQCWIDNRRVPLRRPEYVLLRSLAESQNGSISLEGFFTNLGLSPYKRQPLIRVVATGLNCKLADDNLSVILTSSGYIVWVDTTPDIRKDKLAKLQDLIDSEKSIKLEKPRFKLDRNRCELWSRARDLEPIEIRALRAILLSDMALFAKEIGDLIGSASELMTKTVLFGLMGEFEQTLILSCRYKNRVMYVKRPLKPNR